MSFFVTPEAVVGVSMVVLLLTMITIFLYELFK